MPNEIETIECACCGETTDNVVTLHGKNYCADCVHVCDDCGIQTTETTEVLPGHHVCEDCNCQYCSCDDCGETIDVDDSNTVYETSGYRARERCVCNTCCEDHYEPCGCCDRVVREDSMLTTDSDDHVCCQCYEDSYFTCDCCGEVRHNDSYAGDGLCDNCDDGTDYGHDWDIPDDVTSETADQLFGIKRRYGIELEFSSARDYQELENKVDFGACDDGTHGVVKEFPSAILQGDNGLASIRQFCSYATEFEVNASCGYHLHIDVSDLTDDQIGNIIRAYKRHEEYFYSIVAKSRRNNSFCARIGGWYNGDCWKETKPPGRYYWVNTESINRHGTIEIRLHQGTGNATKIINWVQLHLHFVEAHKDAASNVCWLIPAGLSDYYNDRMTQLNGE